jgi:hypothetical protein
MVLVKSGSGVFSSKSTRFHVEYQVSIIVAKVKYGVRSLKFIWAPLYTALHSLAELRPCKSPPSAPAFDLIYEGANAIGQPR